MQRSIRTAAAAVAVLTAIALAGCSPSAPGEKEEADDPVSLLLPTGAFQRTMEPVLQKFTAETGIKVDAVAMPAEDARSRQVLDLANQTGDIDLILLDDVAWLSQVQNSLEPLNDRIADDEVDVENFLPELTEIFEDGGNQYALPFGVSPRVFYYRADLFEEAGVEPPTTFDELQNLAAQFTTGSQSGFVGPLGRASSYVSIWMQIALSSGMESVLSEDGTKATFNDEGGLSALTLLTDMYAAGDMPQDAIEMEHDGVLVAMQTGRAAMAMLPSTFLGSMNDPEAGPHSGEFRIAPFPTSGPGTDARYVVTGWGYGLSKFSDNQSNAWELEKYLIDYFQFPPDDANVEQLLRPGSEAALDNPATQEIFADGQIDVLKDALSAPVTRPANARWAQIETTLGTYLQESFLGQKSPQEALDAAETEINDLLAN